MLHFVSTTFTTVSKVLHNLKSYSKWFLLHTCTYMLLYRLLKFYLVQFFSIHMHRILYSWKFCGLKISWIGQERCQPYYFLLFFYKLQNLISTKISSYMVHVHVPTCIVHVHAYLAYLYLYHFLIGWKRTVKLPARSYSECCFIIFLHREC